MPGDMRPAHGLHALLSGCAVVAFAIAGPDTACAPSAHSAEPHGMQLTEIRVASMGGKTGTALGS